jgi:ABC-2 type transport system permease protein
MLSSVDTLHLMFGKIIGKGCAGLLQYVLWISVALLITQVLAPQLGATLPSALSGANLAWLLLFFLLAYFLYAGGYAAVGAAADDEQHLGQLGAPFIFMLLIPLVLISLIISSPNGTVAVVLSLVPFTSPVVMLARVVLDTPPLWQLLTSLGLLVGSVVAMAFLAARLFRVAILMRGQRFTLAQVLKLARLR